MELRLFAPASLLLFSTPTSLPYVVVNDIDRGRLG